MEEGEQPRIIRIMAKISELNSQIYRQVLFLGRTTLSGEELRETCENELEQGDLHHLMILLAN